MKETQKQVYKFTPDEVFHRAPQAQRFLNVGGKKDKTGNFLNNWRARDVGPPFLYVQGSVRYPHSWLIQWLNDNSWRPEGWVRPKQARPEKRRGSAGVKRSARSAVRA
jgi:hypothetical protein